MTTLPDFFKTDLVDDHVANDVNVLMAAALRAEYANTETITATKELSDVDCQFQFITASGADRTVELAPEAIDNHITLIYNSGASNNVAIKDDSGTYTFETLAPDEWAVCYPLNAEGWRVFRRVAERDYLLSPSVASNNLSLALKHLDGTDPSVFRPLVFVVNGVRRFLSAATSFTKNAGTNWCNLGAAELAALPHDLFVYAIIETGASAGLKFGYSRIPFARTMGDFVNTTTNEKYIAGNWTNFNATDAVANIGRFRAQLSAAASYNWSIPSSVVVNYPIYETDWLTWAPQYTSGFSSGPTVTTRYKLRYGSQYIIYTTTGVGASNATSFVITKGPISPSVRTTFALAETYDNSAYAAAGEGIFETNGNIGLYKSAQGAWTASGNKFASFSAFCPIQ